MRADRLISLMLLLNARGRMTAQTLADQLEVSERTIYRDVDALGAAGIPIYVQPGVNGGIFLDENYRISLTGLSRAEAQALFISSKGTPLPDLGLDNAVEATLLKLFAALPSAHQVEVERLRNRFYIDPANWFQIVEPSALLPTLQQAVWEDRALSIQYQVVEGEWFEGVVNAYALVAKANIWYLVAEKRPANSVIIVLGASKPLPCPTPILPAPPILISSPTGKNPAAGFSSARRNNFRPTTLHCAYIPKPSGTSPVIWKFTITSLANLIATVGSHCN
jgi:DNA binding protein with HTH domain/WYL domain-containing protein